MLPLERCAKNITLADLQAIEARHHFVFPDAIRAFYLKHNGGYSPSNFFRRPEDDYPIGHFLPIRYGADHLEDTLQTFRDHPLLPQHFVPFSVDGGGDYYGFVTSPQEYGAIYLYSHEDYEEPNQGLIRICSSFTELIENLVTEEQLTAQGGATP